MATEAARLEDKERLALTNVQLLSLARGANINFVLPVMPTYKNCHAPTSFPCEPRSNKHLL